MNFCGYLFCSCTFGMLCFFCCEESLDFISHCRFIWHCTINFVNLHHLKNYFRQTKISCKQPWVLIFLKLYLLENSLVISVILMSNVKTFIFEAQNWFWNLSHLGQENTSIFFWFQFKQYNPLLISKESLLIISPLVFLIAVGTFEYLWNWSIAFQANLT